MTDKEKFEEEALAEFIEMTGIPKEKIKRYGKVRSIKFKTSGETYEYEFKTSGLGVELYVSLLPVLYFPKKPHDISEPVLSHSEISGLIYVYFGGEKYEITKAAIEAVEAIKALEQKPCEDAISRQEVLDLIADYDLSMGQVVRGIHALPSVTTQETRWIPVSERLPEKNMRCLVAVGRFNFTEIATYSDLMGIIDHKIFYQGDVGHDNFKNITQYVKAWMPLPKPYELQESEEKHKAEFVNDALQIVSWKDCECVEFRYQNEYGKKTFRIISLGMLFLNGDKREDVNKFVFDMIDNMRRELNE